MISSKEIRMVTADQSIADFEAEHGVRVVIVEENGSMPLVMVEADELWQLEVALSKGWGIERREFDEWIVAPEGYRWIPARAVLDGTVLYETIGYPDEDNDDIEPTYRDDVAGNVRLSTTGNTIGWLNREAGTEYLSMPLEWPVLVKA